MALSGADTHPLTATSGLCPGQDLGQISVSQTVRASVFVFLTLCHHQSVCQSVKHLSTEGHCFVL